MENFDRSMAINQAGGNRDLAKDLFTMLCDELPLLQEKLNSSYQEKNRQDFRDAAHKIHGSTAYCGVPLLKASSKELEDAIKAEAQEQIDKALSKVNEAITFLVEQADKYKQQL